MRLASAVFLGIVLLAGAAAAQPHGRGQGGGGQGGGHGGGPPHQQGHGQGQGQGQDRGGPRGIADGDRGLIQAYFGQQFAQGNCPPGLAKKGNGCQPPGQARKWAVGQRLPDGLGYALPADLLRRLAPPAGYTYMRVGTDILMIAIGTRMVVSGLADLLR